MKKFFLIFPNYFFGKEDGAAIEVSSGVHFYNFLCRIPKHAPGSIEGKFGHIRYHVEARLDIPYMPDIISKAIFTVIRAEDLSRYAELHAPNDIEEFKTCCFLFCELEPVMLKL